MASAKNKVNAKVAKTAKPNLLSFSEPGGKATLKNLPTTGAHKESGIVSQSGKPIL
ncbi:hypothetical protein [Yoonia sp. BS5-3]|uniref:Uncharacterized protein n=1 Tax=Yoonia phaeophyticola TaxID=3137369 RepID=A0ABZ2V2G1_9RHOB